MNEINIYMCVLIITYSIYISDLKKIRQNQTQRQILIKNLVSKDTGLFFVEGKKTIKAISCMRNGVISTSARGNAHTEKAKLKTPNVETGKMCDRCTPCDLFE